MVLKELLKLSEELKVKGGVGGWISRQSNNSEIRWLEKINLECI